ncbi:MAG: hypothetical protein V8S74_09325 [Lachnospirales bacterium]
MKKKHLGQALVIFLVLVGVFYIIGAIGNAIGNECAKSGCYNKREANSSYCYIHKPSAYITSAHNNLSKSDKSSESESSSNKSYSSSSSSSSSSNYSNSYSSSYSNKSGSTGSSSYSSGTKKNSTSNSSTYKSSTGSSNTYKSSSGSNNTYKSSGSTSSTKKSNPYASYDDGYDDIYMDGDYDDERYSSDKDYANGVDDAIDELGDDY